MREPIRVLHIVGAMYPGGLENFIMNLYEHIDRTKVSFDFAIHARKENDYVELIESMGGRVFLLDRLTSHPVRSLRSLKKLVETERYDVVVRHTSNALVTPQLLAAKRAGAVTVCHSHTSTDAMKLPHYLGRLLMKKAADYRIACSEAASEFMFGKLGSVIVKNAIDLEKFAYSPDYDFTIRDEFGIAQDATVFGHVGNFAASKNHLFMLEVFREIIREKPGAKLIFVGDGDVRNDIEAGIRELGLDDSVILAGVRRDADRFMSAFDLLLFPSVYEGLPLTLIEAQASGLPCLISDSITDEVIVTKGLINYESLNSPADVWARKALNLAEPSHDRKVQSAGNGEAGNTCSGEAQSAGNRKIQRQSIAEAGYDIEALSSWYAEFLSKITGDDLPSDEVSD